MTTLAPPRPGLLARLRRGAGWPWPPPGVAPTTRWRPAALLLMGVLAWTWLGTLVPLRGAHGQATWLAAPLYLALPAGLAAHSWWRHRAFRPADVGFALGAAALALPQGWLAALMTAACVTASLSLLRARWIQPGWWGWLNPRPRARGVMRAVLLGVVLAGLLLWLGGVSPSWSSLSLDELVSAVSGAAVEELGHRTFLLAAVAYLLGGLPRTRAQRGVLAWTLVLPQLLLYTSGRLASGQVLGALLEGAVILVLYAWPLAHLLRRNGIIPAATCHALIDLIRFAALGP